MSCNIGKTDRIIRVVLGIAIVVAGFHFNSWLGALGLIPIVTAAIGWCPLYVPLGASTCSTQKAVANES